MTIRADVLIRRTYSRPKEDGTFETWGDICQRVAKHQKWLWQRASKYNEENVEEVIEFRGLMEQKKVSVSGRTLWMGGTEIARDREISQFNCSFCRLETVHDFVDLMWLLLNGCGTGFQSVPGNLSGFAQPIKEIEVVPTKRTSKGGCEHNREEYLDGVWTLTVGDSGESWAKLIGKLLAGKFRANKLVFDLSEIRPAGSRLSRYGWISSGDTVLRQALPAIANILNRRAGSLLTRLDIHDIANWCGVIQTGRRGAQLSQFPYPAKGWQEFALSKSGDWRDQPQRAQANNSLIFWEKPSNGVLEEVLAYMVEAGGSEPGIINGEAALVRAPWFAGVNPCVEQLLANKGLCNLSELDLGKFRYDPHGLERAMYLTARANYRQTLVNLDDGILQRAWHENNEYLHLCGTGITGIARRPDMGPYDYRRLANIARAGAYSMAQELGTPIPKNVTTIKPSGTLSKIFDTTEGCHTPMGKYIFNNLNFNQNDPLLKQLAAAGYEFKDLGGDSIVVKFPVVNEGVPFTMVDGMEVNVQSAEQQLWKYKMLMDNYVDNNCSITVSYSPGEIPAIVDWLDRHWDSYVGVSFLPRVDPTVTAEDLGYPYLPQEVVSKEKYFEYAEGLSDAPLENVLGTYDIEDKDNCGTGVCPVR